MCTRYSLHNLEALRRVLQELGLALPEDLPARYNVPLTARMPVVVQTAGVAELAPLAFGITLPSREDGAKPMLLANARSETLLARGAFRDAARHRRCLVPADGFYEWEKAGKARLPHYFRRRDGAAFLFAGLWRPESANAPAGFVIVTTQPNKLLQPIHDRMPVMLELPNARSWLGDQPLEPEKLTSLCAPFPAAAMESHGVDPAVGSPRHQSPRCIEPFVPPAPEPDLFG